MTRALKALCPHPACGQQALYHNCTHSYILQVSPNSQSQLFLVPSKTTFSSSGLWQKSASPPLLDLPFRSYNPFPHLFLHVFAHKCMSPQSLSSFSLLHRLWRPLASFSAACQAPLAPWHGFLFGYIWKRDGGQPAYLLVDVSWREIPGSCHPPFIYLYLIHFSIHDSRINH